MNPSISTIELPERFRVSGHVADGGMASVWAAEDRTLGRMVAIKLLAHRFLGDHDAVRRFQREARAAASLSSHPHVVTIFDVGEHEGQPFIVMEYMSGGSLSDVLRTGRRPSRPDILRWLAEAASALDAAHERGIVHRDVKPGNLLLDERGRLGVTDFGIARVAYDTSVTRTGEVMGTAAYLSPEQAAGESGSEASDRYALAVVAYELLCGERPFTATNFAAQARQHLESRPPPPSQRAREPLPAAVDAVLLRGLEKDPAARWPTAAALVEALTKAAGEPATQATVPLSRTEATQAMPTQRAPAASPPPSPPRRPLEPRPQGPPPRAPEPVSPWPGGGGHRGRPRWLIPALVAAAALLAVLLLVALPDDEPRKQAATQPRAQPTASTPEPAPTQRAPAPAPRSEPDVATASRLNDEGFRLIQAGRYGEAVDPLRRSVAACGDSQQVDPCGFALFNLGQALNRSGRPEEAIPILERRLQIPNQQGTVQQELDKARAAAGQSGSSGGGEEIGDDGGNGRDKRKGKKGDE